MERGGILHSWVYVDLNNPSKYFSKILIDSPSVYFRSAPMAEWSDALPLTACCLSPLRGLKSLHRLVRKLPLMWRVVRGFFAVFRFPWPLTDGYSHFSLKSVEKVMIVETSTVGANGSLTHTCLRVPLEIVVWIYNTFDDNLGIKKDFIKHLKESCC